MKCCFCKRDVDTDAYGWGYFMEGFLEEYTIWHNECANVFEDIKVV